jgi:glycogen debranching enzyme
MKDQTSKGTLLSASENLQVEPIKLDVRGDQEQTSTTPLVLKCGDTFLAADVCGDLLASRQEVGLFRHGTRFLRTCNLYLEGHRLVPLSHQVAPIGNSCHIDLTNVSFSTGDEDTIEEEAIHFHRFIELEQDTLTQTFRATNFHPTALQFNLTLTIEADFCDLFEVRGFTRKRRGERLPDQQEDGGIVLRYRGLDEIERTTHVEFQPSADYVQSDRIDWLVNLQQGASLEIRITVKMSESSPEKLITEPAAALWHSQRMPTNQTDDPFFNRLLTCSVQDLMMLSTLTPHGYYPYAGIPRYCCPFGRDGLVTSLTFLPWFPQITRGTLEFLAAYQGKKVDQFTSEEPGKIMHEYRTGEMANCREIPFIPSYTGIDTNALFLMTLGAYIRWTNDLPLLEKLWSNAQAAANWMTDYGDKDGDTFLEYYATVEKKLINQGWKDSWNLITHSDGRLAHPPVALCEVQGYSYAAYQAMSYLAKRLGKNDEAIRWDRAADVLQANFVRDFWWEQEETFYMGLTEHREPCDIVTSNAGQCLWTGIVPGDLAQKVVRRLMREDMFSGWGIRTLSAQTKYYNPMSYHNGSVWPHDSALVGAGFSHYGRKEEAGRILKSLADASQYYEGSRLPELYCGFTRQDGYGPISYPASCSPQAWASNAPFILLSALLGLYPDAERQRLTLDQPMLPDWLNTLEINGIYVGAHRVHLHVIHGRDRTEIVPGRENEVDIRVLH